MRFAVADPAAATAVTDLVVVPVFQVDEAPDFGPLDAAVARHGGLAVATMAGRKGRRAARGPGGPASLAATGFTAKAESLLLLPRGDSGWALLVGLGPAAKVGLETVRRAAGRAAARAAEMKAARVHVVLPAAGALAFDDIALARCWAEGAELALSPVGVLKSGKGRAAAAPTPARMTLAAARGRHRALQAGLAEATAYAAGCLLARELVNQPPNLLTPLALAGRARAVARREGLTCRVLGPARLRQLRMGGLLGVGQGSANPPQLIELHWRLPGRRKSPLPKVALVGKGITFDTGGISLKPAAGMELMKTDMGGAAAVLGAALIAARLRLPLDLTVIIPTAENMPDGRAARPSDIVTMASGKTVEILNTDAEGRLILADALWYAARGKPDHIIDAATLTGACVVALGNHFAGLMGNSAELMDTLSQAGGETFERVWQLPVVDEHREEMAGTLSDLKNIGDGRDAGALTAAAFLSHFVDDETPWAHLDIAGVAWTARATATCPRGATGFGARLIARALQILVD
ncbi:MAG: leucyl aminopeptidase [bacterium]|nr:leucyl aminopeptidase [bacterium]